MRPFTFHQALIFGLLAAGPLAAGFSIEQSVNDVEKRHVVRVHCFGTNETLQILTFSQGSLVSRASKIARAVLPGMDFEKREPHHTEAQIAAKEAAAGGKKHNHRRQEADEFGPWDSTEDEFGSWLDKREPHHTEAQIAAKEAAANKKNHKRHHTEAQIAAKEAAANKKNHQRSPQEADDFGPWDSTEDEFGSWLDKREPHHTEAQIAAKEAAANKKNHKRHHTEAQIAAKDAAKSGKVGGHN
jgi:hypothetical protein